ncbi:hypothetical protein APA_1821 [Pseudanabaena sp. lw0831]|uniref:hypothetical protein n=1 Tax=Pseudanabaena sp. lw0831 TaxID=1357935 RepID=UPI001916C9AE|nr:hypothetical protein [Pseudanabaena sp. lw0831]GBO53873.1 hypothetical protein APA_1821 [Pseudanabaena sp. lw0831]
MERSKPQSPNHLLTIELSDELYAALLEQVQITGKSETDLVVEGLRQVLNQTDDKKTEKDRFAILEANLEKKLKQYVDSLIKDRQSNVAANPEISDLKSFEKVLPTPTIRPLQVGDRVLILEPDSPYYMAKLLVIRTSLIRATVDTDTGEKTFLKRDLRFVESAAKQ